MNNPNNFGRGKPAPVVSSAVLQALAELRHATPHQITEHLKGRFTFAQVKRALHNARFKGLINCSGVVRVKGKQGGSPATYWLPGDAPPEFEIDDGVDLFEPNRYYPPRPQYASVWAYAQGIASQVQRRMVSSVWDLANDSQRARA